MGKFAAINAASVTLGGKYFDQGVYKVRVEAVKFTQNRKREDMYIVECLILESTAPTCPPGIRCSQVISMKQDASWGNVKAFIAACVGIDPADSAAIAAVDDWETAMEESITEPTSPFVGVELALEAVTVKTRAGTDFTKHYWTPLG